MKTRRVNVRGIIWHNEKLLAVRHRRGDTAAPYYAVPGGGVDPFETLVDGLKRELMEETGVEARIGRLLFMQQFPSERNGYDEELEFFYLVENSKDFLAVDILATTHGAQELAVCEFVNPKDVTLLPKFLTTIDIPTYIESILPVELFATELEEKL